MTKEELIAFELGIEYGKQHGSIGKVYELIRQYYDIGFKDGWEKGFKQGEKEEKDRSRHDDEYKEYLIADMIERYG